MKRSAARFGAPVIEPPGSVARRTSDSRASRPQARLHRGFEVMEMAERLQRSHRGRLDAPRLGHLAEVVPQKVHDHHVLGRVLRGGEKLTAPAGVLGLRRAPRDRALDRLRDHPPRREVHVEEQLRRVRHHGPVLVGERQGEGHGVVGIEGAREGEGIDAGRKARAAREIDLVDVAAGDAVADGLDTACPLVRRERPLRASPVL